MTTEYAYPTRVWTHFIDGVRDSNLRASPNLTASHLLTQRSFRWRSSKWWNAPPVQLRHSKSVEDFKGALKKWISANVPIKANKDSETLNLRT